MGSNVYIQSTLDGSRLVGKWYESESLAASDNRRQGFQIRGGVGLVYLDVAYWKTRGPWEDTDESTEFPIDEIAEKLADKLEERQEARQLEKNRLFLNEELKKTRFWIDDVEVPDETVISNTTMDETMKPRVVRLDDSEVEDIKDFDGLKVEINDRLREGVDERLKDYWDSYIKGDVEFNKDVLEYATGFIKPVTKKDGDKNA